MSCVVGHVCHTELVVGDFASSLHTHTCAHKIGTKMKHHDELCVFIMVLHVCTDFMCTSDFIICFLFCFVFIYFLFLHWIHCSKLVSLCDQQDVKIQLLTDSYACVLRASFYTAFLALLEDSLHMHTYTDTCTHIHAHTCKHAHTQTPTQSMHTHTHTTCIHSLCVWVCVCSRQGREQGVCSVAQL